MYQSIITSRIQTYIANLNILSIHQYASKKGVSAEDCLISMSTTIYHQIQRGLLAHITTFDSSDAYDSRYQPIIYDKFRYHAGFNEEGITMIKSLLMGRTSKCIINGEHSTIIDAQSGPYQGSPPAAIIWCAYINPLLIHIEKKSILRDADQTVIGKIQPHGYMDDINVTLIMRNYPYMRTNNKRKRMIIPKKVITNMLKIMQNTIDTITYYLSINNIPQNEDKTHITTINELDYESATNIMEQQPEITLIDEWIQNTTSNENTDNPKIKKTQNKFTNTLELYRNANFKVCNKICKKEQSVMILGVIFDANWTFQPQIRHITDRMRLIRIKCYNLINSNRNSLNIDAISTIIKNTSLSLLYYAGNIWLNQQTRIDPIKNEYHQSIRMLSPNICRLSIDAMMKFNNFPHIDTIHDYVNAKTYSKILRINEDNGTSQFIPLIKNTWNEWSKKDQSTFDEERPLNTVKKYNKYNIALRWYISALSLNVQDTKLMHIKNYLKIKTSYHYVMSQNVKVNVWKKPSNTICLCAQNIKKKENQ